MAPPKKKQRYTISLDEFFDQLSLQNPIRGVLQGDALGFSKKM